MNYRIVHEGDPLSVSIEWTRHRFWKNGHVNAHPEEHLINLYMIVGCFGSSRSVLYIGKAYQQYASRRLSQSDHIKKWRMLRRKYSRHKLMVSFGVAKFAGYSCTARRIDTAESVLIYANWNDRLINSKKIYGFSIRGQVRLTNAGYYRPLHRECFHGTVVH